MADDDVKNSKSESESKMKQEVIQRIGGDLVAHFQDVASHFQEVASLFRGENMEKEAEFYEKQSQRALKMLGWYDPKAKAKARIARLKAQLAKLEAETDDDEG